MNIESIKTHVIKKNESIKEVLKKYLPNDLENRIIVITSKIISISEGQIITKSDVKDKKELIEQEADFILDIDHLIYGHTITIKNGILIPSAGIDESNVEDAYILYPKNVHDSCIDIWQWIRNTYTVKNVGVLITDSHTTPMRSGVTGVALAWCGFEAQYSYIGVEDIYGRPLQCTKVNLIDALAASAVLVMGEAAEKTPIVIVTNAPRVTYRNYPTTEKDIEITNISIEDDLYGPILTSAKWKKGGSSK